MNCEGKSAKTQQHSSSCAQGKHWTAKHKNASARTHFKHHLDAAIPMQITCTEVTSDDKRQSMCTAKRIKPHAAAVLSDVDIATSAGTELPNGKEPRAQPHYCITLTQALPCILPAPSCKTAKNYANSRRTDQH